MLELCNIKKYYANQKAVDDVSFSVKKGSVFGLLGPNGAGKSSILRMITGITIPDSGTITFDNSPFNSTIHGEMIGYMPEERGLYKKMKIEEHALYLAQLKGMNKSNAKSQINYSFDRLEMNTWRNKKVEDLSKGMSQKLQFVSTVLHNPQLLILDEPFSGLDPLNSEVIKNEIFELAKNGSTIIFSTHRMEQVEEICQEIILINKGKIVLGGNIDEIKREYKLNRFILRTTDMVSLSGFNIISNEGNHYIIQLNEGQHPNEIIKECLKQNVDIIHFQEVLPSLNEIFINQVKDNAATSFLN